jgi:hypothetical protein
MKLNLKQPALSQNSKYSLFLLGSFVLFHPGAALCGVAAVSG